MKKPFTLLSTFVLFISFHLTSCNSKERDKPVESDSVITPNKPSDGSVTWISTNKGIGGSHPDTLLIKFVAKDCTNAPIAVKLYRHSPGGSQPDTAIVERVVFKPSRKNSNYK
jgi:hypothetical protein